MFFITSHHRIFFSIFLLTSVGALTSDIATADDAESRFDESDAMYAATLLEGLQANNRSLTSYDVLVTREMMDAKPDGSVFRFRSRCRYLLDSSTNSKLGVTWTESDRWSENSKPLVSKAIGAFLIDGNGNGYYRDLVGIREMSSGMEDVILRRLRWPVFETVGLEKFPDYRTAAGKPSVFWDRIVSGRIGLLISETADDNEVKVRLPVPHEDTDPVEYRWVFDLTTMLPRMRETAIQLRDTGKFIRQERDQYGWEEIDGVYVPKTMRTTRLNNMRLGAGVLRYEVSDDFQFQWNTVENDFDPQQFTVDGLRKIDVESFLEISAWEDH